MGWKELCIAEYRATIEQAERERSEREAQEREQRLRAFGDKLRKLLGIEVHPTELEVTVDGVTFVLLSAEHESHPHVIKIVETCPQCDEKVFSPPIASRCSLGGWLSRENVPEHQCHRQSARETTQPSRNAPVDARSHDLHVRSTPRPRASGAR